MQNIGFTESLTIEFKSDQNKLSDNDIIDAVVAFANTDGGDLFLGVENDGAITGLHKDHTDSTQLAALIANRTIPPVITRNEIIDFHVPVLKISVPRYTSVVASSSGKLLRRRIQADGTPENIPMYPYEIVSRLSSLSLLDFTAQPVPDSTISDLDPVEREHLRNIIRAFNGEQNLLELTDDELDKALKLSILVEGKPIPTFTGLLLIGKKDRLKILMPTAESAIQVLKGTEVIVNESFFSPLLAAFERLNEYMNAWNQNDALEIGLYRITIPDIDYRAFRESLVNAYCHRDYSVLGRVRVQLNDDGLTISNPGGFIEGIDIQNLLDAEPHGRNPTLADAIKRIGLAERTGRGIDRIFEGSLLYGRLLPDYSASTKNRVSLFIPKSIPDKAFIRMLSDERKRTGRAFTIYSLLALNSLKNLHRASLLDIVDDIRIGETKVKSIVESLTESGLVEAAGTEKCRFYILSSKVYKNVDNSIGYVRQTDIDKSRNFELISKLALTQGYITRSDVAALLHITPPQSYRILNKLVDENKIRLIGKGKHAKYILV